MVEFHSIALVSAHPPLPAQLSHGISDLTELCHLAAYVRELVSDIIIPVGPADREPLAAFREYMRRHQPDLVGISIFTCGAKSALLYAAIAKEHGAFVVAGGYHSTALPEEVLESPHVDAVVRGEGEETFHELISDGPSRDVRGLSFRCDGSIVHNPDRPLIHDLDRLPQPLRALRPARFGLDGLHYHTDSVYSSRGCKANCVFCANHLVGKKWRRRSNDSVIAELASISPGTRKKRKLIKIWDANFMTDVEHTAELCRMIIENNLNRHFRFTAETRIEDIIRGEEILDLMFEAGFSRLGSGLESPYNRTLKTLKKGIRTESVQTAGELLAKHNIHFAKFFIIGHDNEDESDILHYANYSVTPGIREQSAFFFTLTPYPGTQTFADYHQRGLIKSYDWDLYTNYCAVIEPNGIKPLKLQSIHNTVEIQYAFAKHFARGKPFTLLLLKTLVLLLGNAKVLFTFPGIERGQIEECLWDTLQFLKRAPETPPRKLGEKRVRDLISLRFFYGDRDSLTVRCHRAGNQQSIVVRDSKEISQNRGLIVNVSVPHLVKLVENLDIRRTGHDISSLVFKPSSVRPRWLFSLAGDLLGLGIGLTRMLVFHIRKLLTSSSS